MLNVLHESSYIDNGDGMMAQASFVRLEIGNGPNSTVATLPCLCPACTSTDIKHNGHDTSVNGNPQYLKCNACGMTFYIHTSYYVDHFGEELKKYMGTCLQGGHLNTQRLKIALNAPESTASNVMARIISLINTSPRAETFWSEPVKGRILFFDETHITIGKKDWFLIVILDEEGRVLHFDITEHRSAEIIYNMIKIIEPRMEELFTHLISDAYPAYTRVAKMLGRDIVHVQHIHKPPYGRIIIDRIHHEPDKIITMTYATTNEIFVNSGAFIVQESMREERKTTKKRGRPKGSKSKQKIGMEKKDHEEVEAKINATRPFVMDIQESSSTMRS